MLLGIGEYARIRARLDHSTPRLAASAAHVVDVISGAVDVISGAVDVSSGAVDVSSGVDGIEEYAHPRARLDHSTPGWITPGRARARPVAPSGGHRERL